MSTRVRAIATVVLIVALWNGAYGVALVAFLASGLFGAISGGLEWAAKRRAKVTRAKAEAIRARVALMKAEAALAKAEAAALVDSAPAP